MSTIAKVPRAIRLPQGDITRMDPGSRGFRVNLAGVMDSSRSPTLDARGFTIGAAANIGDQIFKGVDNFAVTAVEPEELELKRLSAMDREAKEAAEADKPAAKKEERAERRWKELERLRGKYSA